MTAGYVRLSRDDDRRNYSSIENQKLIIIQYAAERNLVIDRWYEDDGVSGYLFDRPGFNRLLEDLDKDVDTVFVKDFSRLGRHNAKILLLLDHFKEQGRRLIVIDDHYDSESSEDDTIGITTWFNERYVKDTSRKIRHAIGARQKAGTLITQPPFGYRRTGKDSSGLEIAPKEAAYIRQIFELYLQGLGYRKIAGYLTGQGIPTPSMIRREQELRAGKSTRRPIATDWSEGMVRDLLGNDFYVGTLRLRKRARNTVHGKDLHVPKDSQYVFEHHHPPIIDKMTFSLVQELKEKRTKSGYKGSHEPWSASNSSSPFGSCLFCKDCGKKLTPIRRRTASGEHSYYICSTYNSKGKRYCSAPHTIKEQDLMEDLLYYLKICRNALCKLIAAYDVNDFVSQTKSVTGAGMDLPQEIAKLKKQLQTLFAQKVRDLADNPEHEALILKSYASVQQNLMSHIHALENDLRNASENVTERGMNTQENTVITLEEKEKPVTPLEILDQVIQKGALDRKDIEILVESIFVDQNGFPEIRLHYAKFT